MQYFAIYYIVCDCLKRINNFLCFNEQLKNLYVEFSEFKGILYDNYIKMHITTTKTTYKKQLPSYSVHA